MQDPLNTARRLPVRAQRKHFLQSKDGNAIEKLYTDLSQEVRGLLGELLQLQQLLPCGEEGDEGSPKSQSPPQLPESISELWDEIKTRDETYVS